MLNNKNFIFFVTILCSLFFNVNSYSSEMNIKVNNIQSKGGIKYLFVNNKNLPIVYVSLAFKKAGYAYDDVNKQGLAYLVSNLIKEGSGENDSLAFAQKLDSKGIDLKFSVDQENFYVNLLTLTENIEESISLLSDTIVKPLINDKDFDRIRSDQINIIEKNKQDLEFLGFMEVKKILFGNHSYTNNSFGTLNTVENITKNDVIEYIQSSFDGNNLVISVAGNIDTTLLSNLFDKYLGKLPKGVNKKSDLKDVVYSKATDSYIFMDVPQSIIYFAQKGVSIKDPNYFQAYFLNYILGGPGMNSMLMERLRVKKGITYRTGSRLAPYKHGNVWVGVLYTDHSTAKEGIDEIKSIIKDLPNKVITKESLELAKNNIISSYISSLTSNGNIANFLTYMQLNDLNKDYINNYISEIRNISLNSINKFIKSFINIDNVFFVEVGKTKNLKT